MQRRRLAIRVEQWEVNGKKTAGNSKTNPEGKIRADKNITATVYFKVTASYPLTSALLMRTAI